MAMEAASTQRRTRWNVGSGTVEAVAERAAHHTNSFAWDEGGMPGVMACSALA